MLSFLPPARNTSRTRARGAVCFSASSRLVSLALLVFAGLASAQLVFAKDKNAAPDWVKEAAAQQLPAYSPKADAVVLLYDVEFTVNAQGRAVEHVREVKKILRPQARRAYSHVAIPQSANSKVSSLHIWSIGVDGHEYAIAEKDMTEQGVGGRGEMELYDDTRWRVAEVPGADVGSVIATEYEREWPFFISEYPWDIQGTIPVRKARLKLNLPAGYTYKAIWKGKAIVKPIDLEHGHTLWEMENVPEIDLEDVPLSPSYGLLASRLDVHYSGPGIAQPMGGEWSSMGLWYEALARDRNHPDEAIAQKAQSLVAGKTDFADRVEAVGQYVQQQIRYVAIEVGISGWQPHAASAIYKNSYGDCKDKATLLSAMLSAVGIRSTWLMVDTNRGVIAPEDPSISGNHMIAAIEIPKDYNSPRLHSVVTARSGKRFLIFDPTWEKTPFGYLESELQGSYGLLVDGKDSEAILLPLLEPEHSAVNRKATFTLDAEGGLKGQVVETRFGDIARYRRQVYSNWTEKQQQEFMDRMLARDFTTFHVSDVKVSNVKDLQKALTVSYDLEANRFGQKMGPLLMLRPRVLGSDGFAVDHKERKVPIDLNETLRVHDEYEITLPVGYAMDEIPRAVKFDVGFATYESSSEMKSGRLYYSRTYTVRDISLPADRYADVQKLAGVIEADEQGSAILKRLQ